MAAIDFPASPTTGQTFTAPNGVIYQYDGVKWVVAFSPTGMVAFRTGTPTGFTYSEWSTTKLPWSATPAYNNGGGLWNGSDYTVKTAGLYDVNFSLGVNRPAGSGYATQTEAQIQLNGAMVVTGSYNFMVASGPIYNTFLVKYQNMLAVNDVLNFWMFAGYGPPSITADFKWTWATIVRLGS